MRNNNGDFNNMQIPLALPGRIKSMFCVILFYCLLGRYNDDNPNLLNYSLDINLKGI